MRLLLGSIAICGNPFARSKVSMANMMGAVWTIERAWVKVLPPSRDETIMMSSSWLQIA